MPILAQAPTDTADARWVEPAAARARRYLRCLRCPRELCADLAQEAMLAALRTWQGREPPLPWLLVTARNAWFAHCRRSRRAVPVQQLQELHDLAVQELGDDGGDARVAALRHCLAALPPRSRLALQLYYPDGVDRHGVAARLRLGIDGVKSLLQRVKRSLKQCIERRQRHA